MIRTVLADDHRLVRDGLRALLSLTADIDIVAEAGTGEEAQQAVNHTDADALILDVEMPGQPIFTTVAGVHRTHPNTRIIVVTMHQDDALRRDVLQRGAHAYLAKTDPVEDIVRALRSSRPTETSVCNDDSSPLSDREREVLALVANAMTNQQVASRLNLAPGTVKRHVANISSKLGAVSRLDAVRRARLLGLL